MSRLSETLSEIRAWDEPQNVPSDNPFKLSCSLSGPAEMSEIRTAWDEEELPSEVIGLWQVSREARLYEDVEYGQWGLVLLSPERSANRTRLERDTRPEDFRADDVVVGEFLGDQDLLVLAPSEQGDRRVLVALPLDGRNLWYSAGRCMEDFLTRYVEAGGDKYWEHCPGAEAR